MIIRVNMYPQMSCRCIIMKHVITLIIYMLFVDPCLHVLPCNDTKIINNSSNLSLPNHSLPNHSLLNLYVVDQHKVYTIPVTTNIFSGGCICSHEQSSYALFVTTNKKNPVKYVVDQHIVYTIPVTTNIFSGKICLYQQSLYILFVTTNKKIL